MNADAQIAQVQTEQTELAPTPFSMKTGIPSIWSSDDAMRTAVKMAEYLSAARIIPQQYQHNPGDCLIAIDLGRQMGLSPVVVMQNTQVVRGNLTWKGSACKALVDNCGRFRNSRYEFCGKPGEWGWGCRLVAESSRNNRTVQGPWVTMEMARKEEWLSKNGSKWQTMPELMMRYRAASFFAKTECPEVLMGFQTTEEMQDVTGEYTIPEKPADYEEVKFSYIPEPGGESEAVKQQEPVAENVRKDAAEAANAKNDQPGLDDL